MRFWKKSSDRKKELSKIINSSMTITRTTVIVLPTELFLVRILKWSHQNGHELYNPRCSLCHEIDVNVPTLPNVVLGAEKIQLHQNMRNLIKIFLLNVVIRVTWSSSIAPRRLTSSLWEDIRELEVSYRPIRRYLEYGNKFLRDWGNRIWFAFLTVT